MAGDDTSHPRADLDGCILDDRGGRLLSLFCFREFSRATGFFREKLMSLLVILGINALTFAALDKWYHLFVALTPIVIVVIAAVSTSLDQPHGYIQHMALASLSFLFFGTCLGRLGYLANSSYYRSLLLLLIFSVQMNDVFAYVVGKSIGGPKLAPRTSPQQDHLRLARRDRADDAADLRLERPRLSRRPHGTPCRGWCWGS